MARKQNTGMTLDDDEQFFFDHAPYSCRKGETRHHGRCVTAVMLADAERKAKEHGWSVVWGEASTIFDGSERSEGYSGPVWNAVLYNEDDEIKTTRGGIEIDSTAPDQTPDGRVVSAQLALEARI